MEVTRHLRRSGGMHRHHQHPRHTDVRLHTPTHPTHPPTRRHTPSVNTRPHGQTYGRPRSLGKKKTPYLWSRRRKTSVWYRREGRPGPDTRGQMGPGPRESLRKFSHLGGSPRRLRQRFRWDTRYPRGVSVARVLRRGLPLPPVTKSLGSDRGTVTGRDRHQVEALTTPRAGVGPVEDVYWPEVTPTRRPRVLNGRDGTRESRPRDPEPSVSPVPGPTEWADPGPSTVDRGVGRV